VRLAEVLESLALHGGREVRFSPNLRASLAVFRFESAVAT
jgi:hypothetical protein